MNLRQIQKLSEADKKNSQPCPPFRFPGVTSRVFPLRADIGKLKKICDTYFNNINIPAHIARFQPAAPLVYLAILHYDQMFEESQESPRLTRVSPDQSRIWVAQHELAFIIPVEWRCGEGDEAVFRNWAFTIPFLFVSNSLSLTLGREIYGWPKLLVEASPDIDQWVFHPRDPSHLVTLSIAQPQIQQEEKLSKLLKVQMKPSPMISQLRPDPNPLAMLFDMPRTALESWAALVDVFDLFTGMPMGDLWRSSDRQDRTMQRMQARKAVQNLKNLGPVSSDFLRDQVVSAIFPDFSYNIIQDALSSHLSANERRRGERRKSEESLSLDLISLKQFHLAEAPERACYQELVRSRIDILNVTNGGLLGDTNYLRSDPSGGFEIYLYCESMGQRIIDSLGLEVSEKFQEPRERQEAGGGKPVLVAVLKPFYPFWSETNLRYGLGETLCWRTGQKWQETKQEEHITSMSQSYSASLPANDSPPEYVTMRRVVEPANPPVASRKSSRTTENPGEKSEVTIRVYPLLTKGIDLARFLKDLDINPKDLLAEAKTEVGVVGQYVYLIIMSTAKDEPLNGQRSPEEVAFSFPVKWKVGEMSTLVLFSPFVFREATNAVILDREVTGRPSVDATMSASDAWLREDVLKKTSKLWTKIIPAPNERSQEGEVTERLLLEISQDPKKQDTIAPRKPVRVPPSINNVMVKQFPDSEDPQKYCFQAIVVSQLSLEDIQSSKIAEDATISIVYEDTGQLIIDRLGLAQPPAKKGETVKIRPVQPFTIQAKMENKRVRDVLTRVHSSQWREMPSYAEVFKAEDAGKGTGKFDEKVEPFDLIKKYLFE